MPVQTTLTGNIYFPDGAKVSVKESGAGSYTDIGAINSPINATFNFDQNQVETSNAGKTQRQTKNMTMAMSLTLIHLDPANISRLSGGAFTEVVTAGGSVATIDNQVIASGAASDLTPYNLDIVETGGSSLKVSSALVITSVTGSTDGALTEAADDFEIVNDSNSPSGKSIVFNVTQGTALTTMAQSFTIVYTSVTPVASTDLYAGTSTVVLNAYAIKFSHNDGVSIDRELEVFSANTDSGGFQFNFKGANEEGVEEMPLTLTGDIDTSLTDGRQLFKYFTRA